MFKKNLILMFIVAIVMGNTITNVSSMFYKAPVIIRKSETSVNKDNYKIKNSLKSNNESNHDDTLEQISTTSNIENINNNVNVDEQANNKTDTDNTNDDKISDNQTSSITTIEPEILPIDYDRTTLIYENDNITLIRVEYYKNNKLTYYSRVEQFDASSLSYVEKIYTYDYENNVEVLVRTDMYSNGILIQSY